MRKFIVLLLLLSAYCVEVNAQYMTARSIVVIKDKSRQKKDKEQANSDAEKEAFEEWKQQMQEKQAQLLNDKAAEEEARIAAEKEAVAKAKAEEQARIAAQKEAVAKAKAEEQARIAAQKEAEAKAKAEEQARIAAQKEAEVHARIAAQKEAKAKAKAEEQARIVAQKEVEAKASANKGYYQYINLSYGYNRVSDFIGLNYIGGYRFNHLFFLGIGVGADFALFTPQMEQKYAYAKPTRVNIPVYLNFRTNFSDKAWSPYISVSAGARISPVMQELNEYTYNKKYTYNQSGVLGDVSFGVERRLGQKSSLYLGIGYRIESFLGAIPMYYRGSIEGFQVEIGVLHGFNVHVGVSF